MEIDRLAAMRRSYELAGLDQGDLASDPVEQFGRWFADAVAAELPEPNAMILATADAAARPSARTVLLKGYDRHGFVFYTNYGSRKAREIAANPQAAVVFPWHALGRQVSLTGPVARVAAEESATYFHTRPYDSRLGAWTSPQSEVIDGRETLEARYAELARQWPQPNDVPVPPFWGGFRLIPETVEFWQGRPRRLHDRLRYRRSSAEDWIIERLAP